MGYQNKQIDKLGFNYVCGTFERVDGKTLTLADVGKNDQFSWENMDSIMFLDNGGGTKIREDGYEAFYSYFTKDGEGAPADGWYQFAAATEEGEWIAPEESDDFSFGAGAVIQTAFKNAALVFSGAVHKGPPTIVIANLGFNYVGNPTPCDLTMADIAKNDQFSWENMDSIMFLDNGGGTKIREDGYESFYSYFTKAGEGAPADGWYQFAAATEEGEWIAPDEEDNDITAGRMFVVQTAFKNAALQFKAALPAED